MGATGQRPGAVHGALVVETNTNGQGRQQHGPCPGNEGELAELEDLLASRIAQDDGTVGDIDMEAIGKRLPGHGGNCAWNVLAKQLTVVGAANADGGRGGLVGDLVPVALADEAGDRAQPP